MMMFGKELHSVEFIGADDKDCEEQNELEHIEEAESSLRR